MPSITWSSASTASEPAVAGYPFRGNYGDRMYTRSIVAGLAVLTLVVTSAVCVTNIYATQEAGSPLETLAYKTGWIDLGEVLTSDVTRWGTTNSPRFEFLDRAVNPATVVLPKVSDRIRLVERVPLYIVDFATLGEAKRLTAPMTTRRGLEPGDRTGLWLDAGSVLAVRSVSVSRPSGELRFVWARVVPAAQ